MVKMTNEESKKMHEDFHKGVRMFLDKLEKVGREKSDWTLCEMGKVSDIMKDLATVEKDLAKIHHMSSEHPVEAY